MLLPKSSCVCILCINWPHQGFSWPKYHFWLCFVPDMGVVIYMYLKYSLDYIYPKYIWVNGITP